MGRLFGETKSLRASERSALEKLASQRCNTHEVVGADLAKRAASLCARLGLQIGLLIGRDGRVEHAVLGARDRLYLPDLGRFRLDQARLRRLRLVVFLPDGQHNLRNHRVSKDKHGKKDKGVRSPTIADDLFTDLEKLRFDMLVVIAVDSEATCRSVSIAYLEPQLPHVLANNKNTRKIGFAHAKDIYSIGIDFESFIDDLESRFRSSRSTGFDTSDDHAVLVGAYTGPAREAKSSMLELRELANTAGIAVLDTIMQRRRKLDPKTVVGKGKLEEIVLSSLDLGADLLVFDRELSAGQLRSITNTTELRVIDRSMLILDIFAQRAKSSEGRLQVELAQLRYSLPRLTEKDTGLSRLTGGIGGRGPGETKLEIGRRRARDRIADLEKRIERLAKQRGLRRERRQNRGVPVIAIVGYTNAGKSTLLNSLTKGEVLAESKLFATLDPSTRRMRFPNDREVVFVDTVGFIRELPKELITAFRATLEEVGEADLLLHVVDASNREMKNQIEVVEKTLEALGVGDKPRLLLLNKVDLLSALEIKALTHSLDALPVSAAKRSGFEQLVKQLQDKLSESFTGQDPGRFTEINQY